MANGRDSAVERVAVLRYWREPDARVVVEGWRRSGERLASFAQRYGIHPSRLSRWAERLGEDAAAIRFYPVRLVEGEHLQGQGCEPIEIVLGESCRVRVPAGFAAEDLRRVLAVLAVAS